MPRRRNSGFDYDLPEEIIQFDTEDISDGFRAFTAPTKRLSKRRLKKPQVKIVVENLKKASYVSIRRFAIDLTFNLIAATPVDTGWAQANWWPSIGSIRGSSIQINADDDDDDDKELYASIATTIQFQLLSTLKTYKGKRKVINIVNDVSYIELLNSGSSHRAPKGFVQIAITKAILKHKNTNIRRSKVYSRGVVQKFSVEQLTHSLPYFRYLNSDGKWVTRKSR